MSWSYHVEVSGALGILLLIAAILAIICMVIWLARR